MTFYLFEYLNFTMLHVSLGPVEYNTARFVVTYYYSNKYTPNLMSFRTIA